MKKLLYSLLIVLLIPFAVRAEGDPNVVSVAAHAEDDGSIILYGGETENSSHAVMCKLLNGDDEIDMRSVEVENTGTDGTFAGTFVAPSTGTYTISCANYEGGTIKNTNVTVTTMTKVTVTFDTGDGDDNEKVQVDVGGVVARPEEDPTKEGKTFVGWFEDATYVNQFDFGTRITANVTIYARFVDAEEPTETNQVQVIFFGEGGTYQVDFQANDDINPEPLGEPVNSSHRYFVNVGDEVILTAIPANGYHLKGWYNTHEENGNEWILDNLLSSNTTYRFTPEDDINIQVVFEEDTTETYTVIFDTNGGSNIAPVEVEDGEIVARPEDPTNGDKIFRGWFADDTCTVEFDFNTPITADTTIYADWADPVVLHTVTFNTSGGSTIAPVEVEDGHTVARPNSDPTKPNKIFSGWYEDEEFEHEYNFTNPITGGTEIYAKWNEAYISDDGNGNEATFVAEEEQNLRLVITDLANLTDAEIAEMRMDRETFDAMVEIITETAKQYGEPVAFLDISVLDENDEVVAVSGINIKLAITDEMGDYKYYKLAYIDTDANDNIILDERYPLTKQGNQLTGNLNHLSAYVLIGNNTEDTTTGTTSNTTNTASATSPKTYDGILTWVITLVISIIGLTVLLIASKKKVKVN